MSHLKAFFYADRLEAGCDEAGRGCLAGPVIAAAVILAPSFDHPALNDSKQISAKVREQLAPIIKENALAWAVGKVSAEEIDQINILNASFLAMHRAITQLSAKPQHLLIDGNRFNAYPGIPHNCFVKGDATYRSIAAASILAKTHRDALMEQLHIHFPDYNWFQNKGYPTLKHKMAIASYGLTIHHRKSFRSGIQLNLDI